MWGFFWFCFFLYVAGFENRVKNILSAPETTEPVLQMMENGENKKVTLFPFGFLITVYQCLCSLKTILKLSVWTHLFSRKSALLI